MRAGSSCQAASSPRAASSGGWAVAGLASAATKSSGTSVATARMASHSTGRAGERQWCLLKRRRDRGILDGPMTVLVTGGSGHLGANLGRRLRDEGMPVDPSERLLPSARSTVAAEHECRKPAADGLAVVIATSCAIVGPNDFKPSRMRRLLLGFARGRLRAYLPGGFEFVAA